MRYLILLLLTALPFIAQADDYGSATVQQVTSIYDGDTFRANLAGPEGEPWPNIIGHRAPIRVAGVDTPEIRAECDAEKQASRRAKQFTVAHLREADTVRLEHLDRGKYFRLVANVMIDGRDLGQMLIDADLGVPYGGGHKTNPWCE